MKFNEILNYLENGEKVYRKKWLQDSPVYQPCYLYLNNESRKISLRYPNSKLPVYTYLDYDGVTADDWEIY